MRGQLRGGRFSRLTSSPSVWHCWPVGAAMTELTKAQRRKFLELVDRTGSANNGERVVARLQMNSFVLKHGKDKCQKFWDSYKARLKARKK